MESNTKLDRAILLKISHSAEIKKCQQNVHANVSPECWRITDFRRHCREAIESIIIDVTIPWSVCLSVTFVHCAQIAEDIDTISFAYGSSISPRLCWNLA